jgi:transposase
LNLHSEQQLKALSSNVKEHRMRKRLIAVAHFKAGENRVEVARSLNVSRRMVNEWVTKYFKGVISALESKKHR